MFRNLIRTATLRSRTRRPANALAMTGGKVNETYPDGCRQSQTSRFPKTEFIKISFLLIRIYHPFRFPIRQAILYCFFERESKMIQSLKHFVMTAVIAVAAVSISPTTASANDCHSSGSCNHSGYYWKTITVYVCKTVPYTVKVRHVKPCGTVYFTYVTKYKTIKVPVQKRIKVWY